MPRNIFARRIQRGKFGRTGDVRLYVEFSSTKGGPAEWEWSPHWLTPEQGVTDLLREAVRVERENRPDSSYLNEFANLARDIIIEHAPPAQIRRFKGDLLDYDHGDGKAPTVRIQEKTWTGTKWWIDDASTWEVGVPFTTEVLRELAMNGDKLEWITWDGKIIDVRRGGESLLES